MKKKFLLTVAITLAMAVFFSSCKKEVDPIKTPDTSKEETEDLDAIACLTRELPEKGRVIDFTDGFYEFAMVNEADRDVDVGYSMAIEKVADQSVLAVSRPNGGDINLCIDISSLLGDSIYACESFSVDIGISREHFASASGYIYTYTGEDNNVTETKWVIYGKDETCSTVRVELSEEGFNENGKNIFQISISQDGDESMPCKVYIDNIIAYDKWGYPLELDSSATMNAPKGFGEPDWSNQVVKPVDEVSLGTERVSVDKVYGETFGATIVSPEMFADGNVITVYYHEFLGLAANDYRTPCIEMEISSFSSNDIFYYLTTDEDGELSVIDKTRWQIVRVYCAEAKSTLGNRIDDVRNYVNESHTICQFTIGQINQAVYTALYDSTCPEYNELLTPRERDEYYANWRNYIKSLGVDEDIKEYEDGFLPIADVYQRIFETFYVEDVTYGKIG